MKLHSAVCLAILSLSSVVLAQEAKPVPAFKNVDIHASAPGTQMFGGRISAGARFEADGYTMMDLISRAYGLPWDRITDGPAWLGTDRFDVLAIVPSGVTSRSAQPMFRTLLADRFKLVVHSDTRPVPVYAVVADKHTLLKNTAGGESQCKYNSVDSFVVLTCVNMTVAQMVRQVADYASEYFDRPLLDKTSLTGNFDFTFRWTPRRNMRLRSADGEMTGISPQDAFEQQLGLKVETRKEPLSVIVVDSVNRTPTPNAPGVSAVLNSPAYTEFDVAEVRVHKPETPFKYQDKSTQMELLGFKLPVLIHMAWVNPPQKREISGGPAWVKTDAFDIIAKAPREVPWENTQLMLRNLLTQRFHLRLHEENQPTTVYALTGGKRLPKLKDADPTRRSECKKSLGDGTITLTCQNTTMKQLEETALSEAWGLLDHPVIDLTGLSGAYDFFVTWSPVARNGGTVAGGDSSQVSEVASAPSGDLTFFEALEKQIGLKLQKQKHEIPVLVIDSAERPVEK
jgi:uncharacterized protein (TIGR03435 family)